MTLADRDALISRLCAQPWPFAPLLHAVPVLPNARVLDVGGGEGGLLHELKRRGHTGPRELIDPRTGTDAHALPFPDASFDVVFMLRVMAHLHTPALALAEACRVLAPNGVLVVAANGPGHLAGPLPAERAAVLPLELPGTRRCSFELSRPVALSVSDQQELARIYGLNSRPVCPVESQLQLAGWRISREPQVQ